MANGHGLGNHPLVVIIGVIAATITVWSFVTEKPPYISEFGNFLEKVINSRPSENQETEEETVQFLSLVEGSPGVPGDGVIVRDDGKFPFFDIQPGFSLRGVTNGITISVFTGLPIFHLPNTGNFNIGLQINFGVEGKPLTQCSPGTSGPEVLTPTVNGVQGIAGIISQSRLNALVDQVRQPPPPGCEAVSLDQFFVHSILIHVPFGNDQIHQLDALAIGIGENVFPTKDTLTE